MDEGSRLLLLSVAPASGLAPPPTVSATCAGAVVHVPASMPPVSTSRCAMPSPSMRSDCSSTAAALVADDVPRLPYTPPIEPPLAAPPCEGAALMDVMESAVGIWRSERRRCHPTTIARPSVRRPEGLGPGGSSSLSKAIKCKKAPSHREQAPHGAGGGLRLLPRVGRGHVDEAVLRQHRPQLRVRQVLRHADPTAQDGRKKRQP